MHYDERISTLEQKVKVLEKKEKRRTIAKWISLGIKLVIVGVMIYFGFKMYKTIIKYKKQLDELTNIEQKFDGVQDWFDSIKGYDIFNF